MYACICMYEYALEAAIQSNSTTVKLVIISYYDIISYDHTCLLVTLNKKRIFSESFMMIAIEIIRSEDLHINLLILLSGNGK